MRTIVWGGCRVNGTKYRWNSISHKIHVLHLVCKTQGSLGNSKHSGRMPDKIVMHQGDEGERFALVDFPGLMSRGGTVPLCCWDLENYVHILGSDLQNLAVFILAEIKNLTVLSQSLASVFVIKMNVGRLKMPSSVIA